MSTVRDPLGRENPDGGGGGPLMSLRALVLLLVSGGVGVVVYLATGDVVGAFTVAVAVLVALAKLVH